MRTPSPRSPPQSPPRLRRTSTIVTPIDEVEPSEEIDFATKHRIDEMMYEFVKCKVEEYLDIEMEDDTFKRLLQALINHKRMTALERTVEEFKQYMNINQNL